MQMIRPIDQGLYLSFYTGDEGMVLKLFTHPQPAVEFLVDNFLPQIEDSTTRKAAQRRRNKREPRIVAGVAKLEPDQSLIDIHPDGVDRWDHAQLVLSRDWILHHVNKQLSKALPPAWQKI